MKKKLYISRLVFMLVIIASCKNEENTNLELLNDQIPKETAQVFGQGVISTNDYEFAITFNPEMDELYFTRRKPDQDNKIMAMKFQNGKWSGPEVAFFTTNNGWDFEPHIEPQGQRLYFGSTRPLLDSDESSGLHQWYCQKKTNGWSTPIPIEKPLRDQFVMYLTSTEKGNLYFTSGEKDSKPEDWKIYNALNQNNLYNTINKLGNKINFSGKWIAHPFIAPDESYIIYDGEQSSGYGQNDLYISFNNNGTWTEAINLGPEVNSDQTEMCASVSPDGKYLFFHRGDDDTGNIYWIEFIPIKERLKKLIEE